MIPRAANPYQQPVRCIQATAKAMGAIRYGTAVVTGMFGYYIMLEDGYGQAYCWMIDQALVEELRVHGISRKPQ